jgi:hypothetical protein
MLAISYLIFECSLCLWTKTYEIFVDLHVNNDPLKPSIRLYPFSFIFCWLYTIACHGCPPVQEKLNRISPVALYIYPTV